MIFELRTIGPSNFGQGDLPPNTLIALVGSDYDPLILFNALQFGRLNCTVTDETKFERIQGVEREDSSGVESPNGIESDLAPKASSADPVSSEQQLPVVSTTVETIAVPAVQNSSVPTVAQVTEQSPANEFISAGMKEEVAVALISKNGISSFAELQAYIDSGKDLIDLVDIGKMRVKHIEEILVKRAQLLT